MTQLLSLLLIAWHPCTTLPDLKDFGTVQCETSNGMIASLTSSVYDLRKASCSINDSDIVRCKNVRIVETNVTVNLEVDLAHLKSHVY